MTLRILICVFFFGNMSGLIASNHLPIEKNYSKSYYANGALKSEGWQAMGSKIDFWIFYHPNGSISSKGHFRNNKKEAYWHYYNADGTIDKEGHYLADVAYNWWIFHDIANGKMSKFQMENNQKNGYALLYSNKKLVKAEKYITDEKVGEWTSVWAFKRDNPNASL